MASPVRPWVARCCCASPAAAGRRRRPTPPARGRYPRSPGTSITEGIGTDRKTANFGLSLDHLDGVIAATDKEAVDMAHHLLKHDGVFVGPSAAMNVVGAVRLAERLGPGSTVVTILCDGGDRYLSKQFDPEWLKQKGLSPSPLPPVPEAGSSPGGMVSAIAKAIGLKF